MPVSFFYDEQIRRFLLQFTRMFSGFQVEYGRDDLGNPTYITVPIRYGDATRNAQTIIQQNSANSLPSTPLMTFYIYALEYARDRVQEPYHVNKIQVRQRTWDTNTDTYETTQGNAFTIERLMPAPYNLTINLDIWTSNTNQKLQLLEQITWLFNPSMEIQSTDNYIDWTSLSVVELDSLTWTSRSIPQGTDDQIDIATMRFKIPIWISAPAKVKKLGVVEKIIASIYDASGDAALALENSDLLLGTRQKYTPYGYQVLLIGNQIQVLQSTATAIPGNDSTNIADDPPTASPSNLMWHTVIGLYGTLRPGISYMEFETPNSDTPVIGTIAYHPSDDRFMLIEIDQDTVPQNTLQPVDAVIDPQRSGPDAGLPAAVLGQRYLLLNSTSGAEAWDGTHGDPLTANANDIIEFDGSRWQVLFDSQSSAGVEFVTNLTTSIQYKWTGEIWIKSYDGLYEGGSWTLVL